MSQYLVRWKFGPNSFLNHMDHETHWYQQFHPSKEAAIKHYTSLLYNSSPSMALTAEIFQLVQLVPGEQEPEDVVDETELEVIVDEKTYRNNRIVDMYSKGYSRREIADFTGLSYQTVYGITRKMKE